MAKLSEIFHIEIETCLEQEEPVHYTLDNLVPKIMKDFFEWLVLNTWFERQDGSNNIYYGYQHEATFEELFQEFLKDYKGWKR